VNLLQRLKTETALAHRRIEQSFDLEARTSSVNAYRDLLARLYGFHAAWEPRAEAVLADPELFRGRRKTGHLIKDLRALGMADVGRLALCPSLIPLRSSAEAIGSMYVVEGSTLGGTIIARHVERGLGLGRSNGCSYFRCYGDDVGPMWKAFGAKLLLLCRPGEQDAVVASANRTFELLHAWLCDH
jgi:heme oxygenase